MGLFSWKTQDTNKSIPCSGSSRKPFRVIMLDNNGNRWIEENYEGYGEFGGKDFYELLAEMNGLKGREHGIELNYGSEPFVSPNLVERDTARWINKHPYECEFQGYFYEE